MRLQSAAAAAKPAFAPNIEPFHSLLKEAVDRIKTVDRCRMIPNAARSSKNGLLEARPTKKLAGSAQSRTQPFGKFCRAWQPKLAAKQNRKPCNKAAAPLTVNSYVASRPNFDARKWDHPEYDPIRGNSPGEPSGVRSDGETANSASDTVQGREFLVAARLGYERDGQPKTSTDQTSKGGHGGPRSGKNRRRADFAR